MVQEPILLKMVQPIIQPGNLHQQMNIICCSLNGSETFIWNMVEISESSFQSTTALDKLGILQSRRYTPIQ